MGLKYVGVPTSPAPVGGSAWMKQRGLLNDVPDGPAKILGETAGLLAPIAAAQYAPKIAGGLLQMADNAAAPTRLHKETGVFIGPSAKTWDAAAARRAQTLAAKGVDQREIWKETGTFKGADGLWRQEVDDTRAGMRLLGPKFGSDDAMNKLGETLDHRLAYKAYPDAKGVNVTYSDATSGGSYSAPRDWAEYIDLPKNATPQNQRSTALHELQHAIQKREGFAKGGAPDDADLLPYARKFYADNIDAFLGDSGQLVKMAKQRAYQNLAGEAEARAVQARMNMNMAQRRALFPPDSYDVPFDQLIVNR